MTKKIPLSLAISMYTAFIGGIGVAALETIRRWHQLTDLHYFINWFDDYLFGAFLVFGAIKTSRSPVNGQRFLIAAWGTAAGANFMSFFGQLQQLDQPDPSQVSSQTVVIIKGIMELIIIICLVLSLKKTKPVMPGAGL